MVVNIVAKVFQAPVDDSDCMLKELIISLISSDNLLPVPLVYIDRVDVVEFLVTPDGVHIGVETAARLSSVSSERHSLPLCKRLYDFNVLFVHILDGELNSSLVTVKVIVESGLRDDKQRS